MNSPFASERAQTKPAVEVFLLLLGIGLVGGLAFSLSGVAENVLPGPEASVNINQDGSELFLTIDSMDDNVGNISINVAGENNNEEFSFSTSDSGDDLTVTSDSTSVEVGETMIIDGFEEGDIVTVTAHADDSDNSNQVETFEVGPTGS